MDNKLINYKSYFKELETACDISDKSERELRLSLLSKIQDAALEWECHIQDYSYKQFCKELVERGIRFTPVDNRTTKAKWTKLFAAPIPEEDRKLVHFEQYRWHLFSFELLPCVKENMAKAAFDSMEKTELYLFFDYADECYLVKNAHLLTAADIEAVKENSPLNYSDLYFFDPVGKWTYVKPHEEYCGPYFFQCDGNTVADS